MTLNFQKPGELEDLHINFLLYSHPGVGKTTLIGTGRDTLILDIDGGAESAVLAGSQATRVAIDDYHDLAEAYDFVRHSKHGFKWVWWDSGSFMQDLGMDQIMEDLHAAKPHRSLWVPDRPEYGENQNRVGRMIRQFKALPINFGITAWAEEVIDTNGDAIWQPMFQGGQGKFSAKICGYMGVVGYYYIRTRDKREERVLLTKMKGEYYAKDRFQGALGGAMINPTIPEIEARIERKKREHRAKSKSAGRPPRKAAASKKTATRKKAT